MSRVALALKTVLARADETPTLIFDEVDAGIGGRSADPVGRMLWRLARDHQVVCVTHLPQIAAYADNHLRIEKAERDGRTVTEIEPLDRRGAARRARADARRAAPARRRPLAAADALLAQRRRARDSERPGDSVTPTRARRRDRRVPRLPARRARPVAGDHLRLRDRPAQLRAPRRRAGTTDWRAGRPRRRPSYLASLPKPPRVLRPATHRRKAAAVRAFYRFCFAEGADRARRRQPARPAARRASSARHARRGRGRGAARGTRRRTRLRACAIAPCSSCCTPAGCA